MANSKRVFVVAVALDLLAPLVAVALRGHDPRTPTGVVVALYGVQVAVGVVLVLRRLKGARWPAFVLAAWSAGGLAVVVLGYEPPVVEFGLVVAEFLLANAALFLMVRERQRPPHAA